ncbi:MAG: GAF domain-containing protein, partial [Chloroflexi bacterium]|nr:GAF domain-containing protein [Chloroflexota bacterium]
MNDQRKTKKQLLEELERERELLVQERDRSLALQEVSNKLAGAHDTDEVLDLIVNEAARLVDVPFMNLRLLEGDVLVSRAATEPAAAYAAEAHVHDEEEGPSASRHAMAIREAIHGDEMITAKTIEHLRSFGFYGVAIFPLLANDRSIGTLSVADRRARLLTDDETSLLSAFADQASLALEKARLLNEAETERARAETERERSDALYRVSNRLAGAHDTDEVLDLIVNEAARLLGAPAAILQLLKGGVLVAGAATKSASAFAAEASSVRPALKVEPDTTMVGHVMFTKKPYTTIDTANDELVAPEGRRLSEKHGFHGAAFSPLVANDQSIGVLTVMDTRIRLFTDDEVSLLSAFADQASLALEKARLLNEAETERERAETERERADSLYRVSNLLASAHDTDEVLDLIVNEATRLVGAFAGQLRLLEGGVLVPRAATESAAALLAEDAASRPTVSAQDQATMMARVMATKKPITVDDATETELVPAEIRLLHQKHGLYGTAAVPLLANDRSLGVLFVYDKRIRSFTEDEVSLLMAFADQAALALEKARLLNEAETERDRSDALYRIANLLAAAHDTDEVLELIVNEAARLLSVPFAWIRLVTGNDLVRSSTTAAAVELLADLDNALVIEERASPAGHAMATKQAVVTEEITQAEFVTPEQRTILEKHGVRGAAAVVPLIA